jgi:hypothetical protein
MLLHLLLLLLRMNALGLAAQQQDFGLADVEMLSRCSCKGCHHL